MTLADDDPAIERDLKQGGLTSTEVDTNLYHDIQATLSRLIGKADQLLDNCTTNLAESWMNIRTKFDGGKVINRCQSGSWGHRSNKGWITTKYGREWGPKVWKWVAEASLNKVFKDSR